MGGQGPGGGLEQVPGRAGGSGGDAMRSDGAWPAEAASVPQARHLLRGHLTGHGQTALLDAAELLLSELVGNVVLHVGGAVRVRLVSGPGEVLVEVRDGSSALPVTRAFSATSSTGRGMRLVHALAAEHGVRPETDGKTVWVRVTQDQQARSDEELLAQFAEVDWLGALDADAPGGGLVEADRGQPAVGPARPGAGTRVR